ncbi:hypothetical protein SAMN05192569_106315 [Parageobacillus thermantarcticus]|jgi:hypothetical protein|uniref:Uncharacterized protein n=1 Tax=Parageobacillus thermantarcticus TaxID=186116 RepID=A0A1I0TUN9_9BACL|nr:hypothetical protein [Parageobacillus thermantarcticus]SFA55549.1 hypothetical protein SAMN05192569_106315 [Parageobacillus thermantarcticus]
MRFEEAFPAMREGKTIKSKKAQYGIRFKYETFGCVDDDDRWMISRVDENGKDVYYADITAEDLLAEDYEILD